MSMSVVTQRQSIAFSGTVSGLKTLLERIGGPGTVEILEADTKFKVFSCIELTIDGKILIMEWQATPLSDMFADTVLASLMQTELVGNTIKSTGAVKGTSDHFKECLIEALQDIFGENSVPKMFKGDTLTVSVNEKEAQINLSSLVSAHIYHTRESSSIKLLIFRFSASYLSGR